MTLALNNASYGAEAMRLRLSETSLVQSLCMSLS